MKNQKYVAEFRQILNLGFPIMIALLAQTAMGFTDTLMAGHVSDTDLAAIALGTSIWVPLQLSLSGILMATTPLVAHLVGANREQSTLNIAHQGGWIALVLSIFSLFILSQAETILIAMSVAPILAGKSIDYINAVAWGFPAILLYQVCRGFCEGYGKTKPIMKIAILGLCINIPLNYIFIYGKLGIPAMGATGCGWATAIVMWSMLVAGCLYLHHSIYFRSLQPFNSINLPQKSAIISFLALGIPIGIAMLIETSMFSVISLLLAKSGEIYIAAHQITLSITSLTFMIPLSLATAVTIRIGQLLGAEQHENARHTAISGLILTSLLALFSASIMFTLPTFIASWYTNNSTLINLAAQLIIMAGFFQVSDSIQVTSAGALRGYKDTSVPLAIVFTSYWLVGLPVGYSLALTNWLTPAMGALGFWVGLALGLTVGAILLFSRLLKRSQLSRCSSLS